MLPTVRLLTRQRPFRLTLYTGADCQLCQVMQHEINKASKTIPIELATYNIRDDSLPDVHTWRRKYQYDIPVLHLGERELFRHRVTAEQLIQKLQREPEQAADDNASET